MYLYLLNNINFPLRTLLLCVIATSLVYLVIYFSTFVWKKQKNIVDHRQWADSKITPISWGLLILLGFCLSNTWTYFSNTQELISQETAFLRLALFDSNELSKNEQIDFAKLVKKYSDSVLYEEWAHMRKNELSPHTHQAFAKLYLFVVNLTPKNRNEADYISRIQTDLQQVNIFRKKRLEKVAGMAPKGFLNTIIFLALINCFVLAYIRGECKFKGVWHLLFFTVNIAIFVSLIIEFNYPFAGQFELNKEAYEDIFIDVN
jgi:hypothetical protein